MKIVRILALVALTALTIAFGASPSATVTWTAPTQYTDGTPISNGDLDHYTLTWIPSGSGGPAGSMTVPATALTASVPVACGTVAFSITVTTGTKAKYPNSISGPAGPVAFTSTVSCAANPPSGLAVH